MNNKKTKLIALAMAAALALSACSSTTENSGSESSSSGESTTTTESTGSTETTATNEDKYQIKDLVLAKLTTAELETWNILHSQSAEEGEVLTQLVDGLLETDNKGNLTPAIAESWESSDGGKTWTFKLREGVKWVDYLGNEMADCNAWDFATGLEWVLNYHKNDSANTSMPMELIEGAEEYYEWTKTLSEDEAYALTAGEGSKFLEMVGLEVVDDHTLVYTCTTEKPYFDTLACYCALYPLDQGAVDAAGGAKAYAGGDNTTIWYNGCYTVTDYTHGNSKYFEQNPLYWDSDAVRFDSVTYMYCDSNDTIYQLFQNGEVDYCALTEANLTTIAGSESHEYNDNYVSTLPKKYSYQWHWNFNKYKKNADGTTVIDENWNKAIANTAFRTSIMYGLDLGDYYKRSDQFDPYSTENNYYTMKGLVYTSDGTDYTDLVASHLDYLGAYNGESMARGDQAKFEELKAQAIEELTALGVTFPVELDYYISASSQTALDTANVLKDCIKNSLGDDYLVLNICTYVSSAKQEVYNPRLQSIAVNGWGADYGDPMNYLAQEILDYDNAYYSTDYSNINDVPKDDEAYADLLAAYQEFTDLVWEADAITDDMDARYAKFAEAEAVLLENCLTMPCNYSQSYCLSKVNVWSYTNAMFGSCNAKLKNVETSLEPYTQEQWEVMKQR